MPTTAAPSPADTTDSADLRGYRAVHLALRDAAHAMAAAAPDLAAGDARRVTAFARYWKGYAGEVHAHHTTEDDVVFPALVTRAPEIDDLLRVLDADHHHLDELMVEIDAAIDRVVRGGSADELTSHLQALAAHMDQHLAAEDEQILPRISAHFTQAEYDVLEQQALKEIGLGAQAFFTLPFIEASVAPDERAALLGDAPLPVKVILRLARGRHRRLAGRALAR
jgi:hemerythrin-like domain-containing protein